MRDKITETDAFCFVGTPTESWIGDGKWGRRACHRPPTCDSLSTIAMHHRLRYLQLQFRPSKQEPARWVRVCTLLAGCIMRNRKFQRRRLCFPHKIECLGKAPMYIGQEQNSNATKLLYIHVYASEPSQPHTSKKTKHLPLLPIVSFLRPPLSPPPPFPLLFTRRCWSHAWSTHLSAPKRTKCCKSFTAWAGGSAEEE